MAYGSSPSCGIERSCLGGAYEPGPHHRQVLQQLDRAALFWRWPIIQLAAVNLARKVKEDADLVLK